MCVCVCVCVCVCAFMNGMTDNLVGDKLTTSGRNVVLKAFTNRCGNLKRVLTIERAFETLRGAQTSPDKQPQTPEDSRLSNCGGKKRQVVWLVDQTEAGQPGFWREARLCGLDMEKQYQDGEETSDVAVGSGCGQVQYYTHRMTQNEMQQLRFHDQARSDLIFDRELAQASMQTSRDDQSQSDPKDIPTETELHSPEKNPVVLPKTLPKPADAATPSPTVPAADESSTGNSLSGDCANAPDTAPRNELVGVSKKKRSASCRGEDGEDDEDGEECAAATKLRRGEDGEEGQTRIVTTTCYDPRFDPNSLQAFLCFPISGYCQTWLMLRQVCSIWKSFMHVNAGLDLLVGFCNYYPYDLLFTGFMPWQRQETSSSRSHGRSLEKLWQH